MTYLVIALLIATIKVMDYECDRYDRERAERMRNA